MMIVQEEFDYVPRLPSVVSSFWPRKAGPFFRHLLAAIIASFMAVLVAPGRVCGATVSLSLSSAPGSVLMGGADPNYLAGFGNVNGLGAGVPGVGITALTTGVTGGVLYVINYNLGISGLPSPHTASVSAYVSTNFARPTVLILETCYPSTSCSSPSNFTAISTSPASPTPVIAPPGVDNGTYTASLGLFVANVNGASSFGSDSAILTIEATDTSNGKTSAVTLDLSNPTVNIQSAVGLIAAPAPGGLAISPAGDFSMDFGNVNGAGIGPSAGSTVVSAPGGVIYSTPYLLQPSFCGFLSTTASIDVYVSMDFVHSAVLQLEDAATPSGPYTAISKSSGIQSSITVSASTGSSLTRYLGLFVSNVNGPTAFTGSDSAILTYTLTVP